MEVERVETIPIRYDIPEGHRYGNAGGLADARSAMLVRIETRDGTVGWGEGVGPPQSLSAIVDEGIAPRVVGMDPFDAAALHEEYYAKAYHFASNGLFQHALSGVDIALWDLKGKAVDRPVGELLDGPSRETVPTYASIMYFTEDDRDYEAEIEAAIDEGFEAAKIKIGRGIENDVERVELARDVLGEERDLMVDVNGRYRPDQAIRSARAIEAYDIGWYEEPVPPEDEAGYAEVREAIDIPVAGGEAVSGRFDFDRLFDSRCVDIAQPDLCMCGGLSEGMAVAKLGTAHTVAVTPHCWMSAVGIAASLQFAAAAPTYPYGDAVPEPIPFEVDRSDNDLRTEIVTDPVDFTGGEVAIPDGPGLGITVDEAAVRDYRID